MKIVGVINAAWTDPTASGSIIKNGSTLSGYADWVGSGQYPPHGFCLMWDPRLIALEWLGHGGVAIAYTLIPIMLLVALRRFKNKVLLSPILVIEFAAFIACCAISHVLHIVNLYYDFYWVEAVWSNVTAFVSLIAAVTVPFVLSRLMRQVTTDGVKRIILDPHNALANEIHEEA